MSEAQEKRVLLVLDPNFGERLAVKAASQPVWIIRSSTNTPVVQRLRVERGKESDPADVATFNEDASKSAEEQFLSIIGTIDLHHGSFSAAVPYSMLEVVGCEATGQVLAALDELGLKVASVTDNGFVASR
jgi:hypothetical protein